MTSSFDKPMILHARQGGKTAAANREIEKVLDAGGSVYDQRSGEFRGANVARDVTPAPAPLTLTDDERALILALREIEARPDTLERSKVRDRRMVWFGLLEARAMLYRDAIRHCMNDAAERQMRMMALISPFDLIDLVRAWRELDERKRADDDAELWGGINDGQDEDAAS